MAECAFCPSTAALTSEHLWSDWINRILPKSTYTFTMLDIKTKKERTWKDEKLNPKTRVVCHKCNHGWMSDLENKEAKPSLTPLITDTSPRIVPIRLLISIGLFLFKTAVIADRMGIGGTSFFTIEERYRFREKLHLPPGISMWIGALEDSVRGTFKTLHVNPVAATDKDFGLYAFTYIAGHLVLQFVAAKWATYNLNRSSVYPKFPIQMDRDATFMTHFWPIDRNIQWPPPNYIPVRFLDQLTDRWRVYNII